ncbi:nucleotide disphospho-sugar-binding domain-containing protein [Kutzneria chonburiensis]|uniref:Nucleotide disphospho-sugar-binding domain-containing protein n=1 Tax=Kutzneria chonburiensis TaxID=1483604 RepID=A0ABV6MRS7_9PSEU|nr:nucleotide disphospho-sugar-binding domain-containing protein [Kutzneria chonburiensis]
MRVLFTTWAWPSHLAAMTPLAWAFQSAGHEVLVAVQPSLLPTAAKCGLLAHPIGDDVDSVAMVRQYVLPSAAGGTAPSGGGKGPRALQMFLAHTEAMTDDLVEVTRRWAPDFVVFDTTTWAGPIAAAAAGVPPVRHLYGPDLLLRAGNLLPELLAPIADRHGVSHVDPMAAVAVDPTPPSLRFPGGGDRITMRHLPFTIDSRRIIDPPPDTGKPRVLVSWGHTIAKLDPALFPVGDIVRGLKGLDVVVAISAAQRDLLGPLPDGVTVVEDVPLDLLLPQCQLLIGHGGAATVLTGLAHGVPQLHVPQLPDHAGHSGRVEAAGAGIVLTRDEAVTGALRVEVEELLAGERERDNARRIAAEIAASATPAEVARSLVAAAESATIGLGSAPQPAATH